MIVLDGSYGEGGGQILRTALSLSLVTGAPFRIEKIRARRERPGLLRQHLTAVSAAQAAGQARVEGAELGSSELSFFPGRIRPGTYRFATGTAGSATLVLQTVLPALLIASGPSQITLEGGTHNPLAPPFDFLAETFLPVIERMGPKISAVLERPGFYPAGGGKFTVSIKPAAATAKKLSPLDLLERGPIRRRQAKALVAGLPRQIAERELAVVERRLGWKGAELEAVVLPGRRGPGNALLLEIGCERITEVFAAFGARGVPAEAVAESAVKEAQDYLSAAVPVGAHLADQLLIPMALAGQGSFRTLPLTPHAATNIEIIKKFLPVAIEVAAEGEGRRRVTVG